MSVTIEVTLNRFGEFAGTLDSTLQQALDAGVQACIATSQQLARVDTGRMRSDISISGGTDSRTITWNAGYSGFNEFGTVHMSAQPFVRPGADAALPVIQAQLGRWPG